MTAGRLFSLSLAPAVRMMRRCWLRQVEQHYLMCAEVEAQRAREHQRNVAYYQKQAALARSAQHD